jgi:hypothetical protein
VTAVPFFGGTELGIALELKADALSEMEEEEEKDAEEGG